MSRGINERGIGHIVALMVFVLFMGAGGAAMKIIIHDKKAPAGGSDTVRTEPVADITDFTSCSESKGSRIQESYPEVCVTKAGVRFTNTEQKVLPADWTWYENTQLNFRLAYPKHWEKEGTRVSAWSGDPLFQTTKDTELRIQGGCGDCRYMYNAVERKWYDEYWNKPSPDAEAVVSTDNAEAYILPIKGAFNCGTSAVAIRYKEHFIHAALSMCSPADFADALQPSNGQLWKEDVEKDLKEVLASISDL